MDRSTFIDKSAAQLKEWDAKLQQFEAKAQKAEAKAKAEYNRQIQDLYDKKKTVQQKIRQLEQTSEHAWEELKLGCEMAFSDMKESMKAAIEKLK